MTTSGQQLVEDNLEPTIIERRARALREVRIRTVLFNGLLNKTSEERASALNKITQLVKSWAKELYPPEPERSTAGTVGGDRENVSGVSSPLYNNNSSKRSSISDGNNPLNSPLFTDGSGSASASSYAASPVVDSGFNVTPITKFASSGDEGVDFNEDMNGTNAKELKRDGNSDGPGGDSYQRRNSADESLGDDSMKSIEERKERLRLLILTMLRMSIDCPFADVRHSFNKCLHKLRLMEVPMPAPINPLPSSYIAPDDILTIEWPSAYTSHPHTQSRPRPITPSGRSRSSSCSSSSSSNSSSFSEEIPRVIQQPLTPSTPLFPTSPAISPVGRQPDELTRMLMIDTFINLGRLSHFYRVLAYFPSFMEKFQKSYNSIIRSHSGPLHVSWRLYIGMMAASQHKCQYVVSKLTDEFIVAGGNIDWLQGLQHAPVKIRNLATINTILAHQPWRLQASHIGALAKGSPNPQDNWKVTEIVHAIVILSTFHSLSSYALGCGIVPEYDSIGGNYELPLTEDPGSSLGIMNPSISSDIASGLGVSLFQETFDDTVETVVETTVETTVKSTVEPTRPIAIQNKSPPTPKQSDEVETIKHTNKLIERLKKQRELQISTVDNEDTEYGSAPKDNALRVDFDNVEEETFTDDSQDDDPSSPFPFLREYFSNSMTDPHTLAFNPSLTNGYFSRFLDPEVEIPYEDFDVNSSEYNVFKLGDYCWETQGVVMVNNYLPSIDGSLGIGEFLDREFTEIRDLTDYRLFQSSNIDLDTKPLRQAVWFYVQRLSGLLKDDYEYCDLNKFLNTKIKKFLKKICWKPEEIEYKDWRNIGFYLREEEKCHVNLIAVEARKQAELVYGLSSVMKWEDER